MIMKKIDEELDEKVKINSSISQTKMLINDINNQIQDADNQITKLQSDISTTQVTYALL